ncbi:hypothetical protein [Propionivibrio sp.]|uniref:hypothetical protein n=1 Tax=Propionivibrio sp. TaxID=2212460 RepID=UPI003BF1CAE7
MNLEKVVRPRKTPKAQLKIDQGFVGVILIDPDVAAIARMVVALAEMPATR